MFPSSSSSSSSIPFSGGYKINVSTPRIKIPSTPNSLSPNSNSSPKKLKQQKLAYLSKMDYSGVLRPKSPTESQQLYLKQQQLASNRKRDTVNRIFNDVFDVYDKGSINTAIQKARDTKQRQQIIDKILTRREEIQNAEQIMQISRCAPLVSRFMKKIRKNINTHSVVNSNANEEDIVKGIVNIAANNVENAHNRGLNAFNNTSVNNEESEFPSGSNTPSKWRSNSNDVNQNNIILKGFALSLFYKQKDPVFALTSGSPAKPVPSLSKNPSDKDAMINSDNNSNDSQQQQAQQDASQNSKRHPHKLQQITKDSFLQKNTLPANIIPGSTEAKLFLINLNTVSENSRALEIQGQNVSREKSNALLRDFQKVNLASHFKSKSLNQQAFNTSLVNTFNFNRAIQQKQAESKISSIQSSLKERAKTFSKILSQADPQEVLGEVEKDIASFAIKEMNEKLIFQTGPYIAQTNNNLQPRNSIYKRGSIILDNNNINNQPADQRASLIFKSQPVSPLLKSKQNLKDPTSLLLVPSSPQMGSRGSTILPIAETFNDHRIDSYNNTSSTSGFPGQFFSPGLSFRYPEIKALEVGAQQLFMQDQKEKLDEENNEINLEKQKQQMLGFHQNGQDRRSRTADGQGQFYGKGKSNDNKTTKSQRNLSVQVNDFSGNPRGLSKGRQHFSLGNAQQGGQHPERMNHLNPPSSSTSLKFQISKSSHQPYLSLGNEGFKQFSPFKSTKQLSVENNNLKQIKKGTEKNEDPVVKSYEKYSIQKMDTYKNNNNISTKENNNSNSLNQRTIPQRSMTSHVSHRLNNQGTFQPASTLKPFRLSSQNESTRQAKTSLRINNINSDILHESRDNDNSSSFASFTEIKLDQLYKQSTRLQSQLDQIDRQSSLTVRPDIKRRLEAQKQRGFKELSSARSEIQATFMRKFKSEKAKPAAQVEDQL